MLTSRLAHLTALEAYRQAIVSIDVDVPVGTFMARVRDYKREYVLQRLDNAYRKGHEEDGQGG